MGCGVRWKRGHSRETGEGGLCSKGSLEGLICSPGLRSKAVAECVELLGPFSSNSLFLLACLRQLPSWPSAGSPRRELQSHSTILGVIFLHCCAVLTQTHSLRRFSKVLPVSPMYTHGQSLHDSLWTTPFLFHVCSGQLHLHYRTSEGACRLHHCSHSQRSAHLLNSFTETSNIRKNRSLAVFCFLRWCWLVYSQVLFLLQGQGIAIGPEHLSEVLDLLPSLSLVTYLLHSDLQRCMTPLSTLAGWCELWFRYLSVCAFSGRQRSGL